MPSYHRRAFVVTETDAPGLLPGDHFPSRRIMTIDNDLMRSYAARQPKSAGYYQRARQVLRSEERRVGKECRL